MTTRSLLQVNQTLMIPQRSAQGLPTPVSRVASAASASAPSASTVGPTTYRVRRGDTLYAIARRFDTTVDSIKRLNRLVSNRINIGDNLTVR
jgi:LysM repeat protein